MQHQVRGSGRAATGLQVCKELATLPPDVGLDLLKHHVSSIAALRDLVVGGAVRSIRKKEPEVVGEMAKLVKMHGIVPLLKGFAMRGLQQACGKPSLLQPELLQLIAMICEMLGHTIPIDNAESAMVATGGANTGSKHTEAADSRSCTSRPQSHEDLLEPIAKACSALAADLESAVQQQQQKSKGLRDGFLASSSQQRQPAPKQQQDPAHQQQQQQDPAHQHQQQQQQQRSWDLPPNQSLLSLCMSLGRGLLTVWNAAVASLSDDTRFWSIAMIQTPASRAALLPVVELLLAMHKARKTIVHCTYSSREEERDAIASVAVSGAVMQGLAQAITHVKPPHIDLPGVRQFVTSQQLQQLLIINLAWHVEMLDRLRQSERSVVSAELLKCLGNKASRPCKQQQLAPSGSSSSSSGDDSAVPPHHLIVFQLLGVADRDPARLENMLAEDKVVSRIPDACTATAMALQYTIQDSVAAAAAAGPDTGNPAGTDPEWPQKAVALVRMLLQLQQLLPRLDVVFASCNALIQVMRIDFGVWKLAIASEANQELLLLLQPAVLQAVHQAEAQQQQRQQQMVDMTLRLSGMLLCKLASNVDPDHWKKAIVASPQVCYASLEVAFRTIGAAAAAVATGSRSIDIPGHVSFRDILVAARDAMETVQVALKEYKALVAQLQSTEASCGELVHQQHAPFLFSLMVTLLKCGAALRQDNPANVLLVAECVAGSIIRSGGGGSSSGGGGGDGRNKSSVTKVVGSRGRVDDFKTSSQIVQQGLFNFYPGGASSSSIGSSTSVISNVWYREDQIAAVTPWIVAAARSMFMIGQVVCEVLGTQQQCKQLQHPLMIPGPSLCEYVLLNAFACVEWLGSELCNIHLPGDTVDYDSSDSSRSSRGCDSASGPCAGDGSVGGAVNSQASTCRHATLQQLLEQQSQTQQALLQDVQRCLDIDSSSGSGSGGGQTVATVLQQFEQVWGVHTAQHLKDFAASVTAALPVRYCCNNPSCCNLDNLGELQLVAGSGELCGQCLVARYCGPVCQKAHWKMHKAACKQLAAQVGARQK